MTEEILQIKHLSQAFGKNVVLRDIDFSVSKGDVISIIGASGSGKSTLLRCINLLETPTGGEILFHGKNIMTKTIVPLFSRFKTKRLFCNIFYGFNRRATSLCVFLCFFYGC